MPLDITPSTNATDILPILRVLRDKLPEEVAARRLQAALDEGYQTLLARQSDRIVGCLGYRIVADVFWGKTLFIDDLVVGADLRGHGVGRALLETAKAAAQDQSCDMLRLCSGLARQDTHRFYERNGLNKASFQFACPIE